MCATWWGNSEAQAIVKAIATLGLNLDMAITAEGVESAEQLEVLRDLGCDEAQGYHLCRPQPVDEVTRMLNSERRLSLVAHQA